MKNIKNIFFVLLAICLTACNNDDFFKLQRPPQNPWNSVDELEFAAVSPYNKMFYAGWSGAQSNQLLNQVIQSDYFRFLGNVEGYATSDIYTRKYDMRVSDIEGLYEKYYAVIGLCNSGLEAYRSTNNVPFPLASDSDKVLNIKRIKGELLFMRAYAYYQLAITFCPAYGVDNSSKILVKRDHVSLNSVDALNNAPVTTGEIYELIVSDLKQAVDSLPIGWAKGMHISYKNRARANQWTAKAFLAQVYMTMGIFSSKQNPNPNNALTLLDDIIGNGGYSLETNPFDCFNNSSNTILPTDAGGHEVLFWTYCGDNIMFPTLHNELRVTHFNKCGRDAKNGGNGSKSTSIKADKSDLTWSNIHDWLQLTLSKNALIDMGWMDASGAESVAAKWDKRYFNQKTPATAGYINEQGLFYRYEGAYADTTAYRIGTGIATSPANNSKRSGASFDGKYIISPKFSGLIGDKEPVVIVNKYFRTSLGNLQNTPLIRLSELYLNRAMIKLHDKIPGWSADYNVVANRAWNATLAGSPYDAKADNEVNEKTILVERWKELAGEDAWYLPFCKAFGITVGKGDRTDATFDIDPTRFATDYWKNCIPLSELDFQKK